MKKLTLSFPLLLSLSLFAMAAGEKKAEPPADFKVYWSQFRKAVHENEKEAVASLTNFPFKTRGEMDDDPVLTHDRKAFLAMIEEMLAEDSGSAKNPATMRELIEKTTSIPERAWGDGGRTVRIGNFIFENINKKWLFSYAYTTVAETEKGKP